MAIKSLPETAHARERRRLRREARALAALHNPNIVTIHDMVTDGGREHLVMELLTGETLARRMSRGRLPPQEVVQHLLAIAEALAAAHRVGIVHRDLKPENVMVTETGVKVIDFGLAYRSSESRLTGEGMVVGTSRAMSPEQARGQEPTAPSDLFALGSLAYEALCGVHPFAVDDPFETMRRIVEHSPERLDHSCPDLDQRIVDLVHRLLAAEPSQRPSADAVAHQLRRILTRRSTRLSGWFRADTTLKKTGIVVIAVGMAAALVVAIVFLPSSQPGLHVGVRPAFDRQARIVRHGVVAALASTDQVSLVDPAHLASLAWANPAEVERRLEVDILLDVVSTDHGVQVRQFDHGAAVMRPAGPTSTVLAVNPVDAWRAGFRTARALFPQGPPPPDADQLDRAALADLLVVEHQIRFGSHQPLNDLLDRLARLHHSAPALTTAALLEAEVAHALWTIDPTRTDLLKRANMALTRARENAPLDGRVRLHNLHLHAMSTGTVPSELLQEARDRLPADPGISLLAEVLKNTAPAQALEQPWIERLSPATLASLASLAAHDFHGEHDERGQRNLARAIDRGGFSPVFVALAVSNELDRGDPREAAARLRQLQQRTPHPVIDNHLALAWALEGRPEEACTLLHDRDTQRLATFDGLLCLACGELSPPTTTSLQRSIPTRGTVAEQLSFVWNHADVHSVHHDDAHQLLIQLHSDLGLPVRIRLLLAAADLAHGERDLARATLLRAREEGASRYWLHLPVFATIPSVVQ